MFTALGQLELVGYLLCYFFILVHFALVLFVFV